MDQFLTITVFGILLVLLGIMNMRGNISSIHWYNRRRVTAEDIPKYGRCMGLATVLIGVSMIVTAVLGLVFRTDATDLLILPGLIVGIGMMLYAQLKYNKGIF